jgi:hypothetical protein
VPAVDGREAAKDAAWLGEPDEGPDHERLGEQLLAERGDQLVDVASGHRIQPRGRLLEEQHLRVAELRPGQGDPLAQTFGEGAAGLVGPVGQVDGPQGAVNAILRVGCLVEVGENIRGSRSRSGGDTGPATRA